AFPPSLAARKITNPDAPRNDHFILLEVDGKKWPAVPILFSTSQTYDPQRGGEFFAYLDFQFLLATRSADASRLEPALDGSAPKLAGLKEVSGFFEQVGKNTDYILHPEEILADNFALLVLGEKKAPSPRVLQQMKEIFLTQKKPAPSNR
ncbi:MAG: hypothetical protein ABIR71_12520, partial [Chthoniobacterales bacterium]